MAVTVRTYQDADLPGLAALLTRNSYGPAAHGRDLGPEDLAGVLLQRCVTDLLVGEEDGRILGCLAFGLGSGRRACEPDARFAGLYVVDRSQRKSLLPGRLFREGFSRMMHQGEVRTLRLEASPTNSRALGLYVRAGFRAAPTAHADEDGYLELVTHLPGVIEDLFGANRGYSLDNASRSLGWEMVRLGRSADFSTGMTLRDGRWVITYPITAGQLGLEVDVDLATGTALSYRQTSGEPITLPSERRAEEAPGAAVLLDQTLDCGARLRVDGAGTLRLTGRSGHELVRERWPVELGVEPPAVRRQGHRRRVSAAPVAGLPGAWRLTAQGDPITRLLRIRGDRITVESTPDPDRRAVVTPWIRTRVGSRALMVDGRWRSGPLVYGLWPEEWTDFEAAYSGSPAAALWWTDGTDAVTSTWSGAEGRPEGLSAPQLVGETPGGTVTYRLEVTAAGAPPQALPLPGEAPIRPVVLRRRSAPRRGAASASTASRAARADPSPVALAAERSDGERVTLHHGDHEVMLAAATGLVRWTFRGTPILTGGYPNRAPLGAYRSHRVAMWCAATPPRGADDQGVEWIDDDGEEVLEFQQQAGLRGWSLAAAGERTLRVEARLVDDPGGLPGGRPRRVFDDAAIVLTPQTRRGAPLAVRVAGRLWRVENAGLPWRCSVEAAAVELDSGLALVLSGVHGQDAEIFIRRLDDGVVLSVLAAGGLVGVDLTVTDSLTQAERALSTTGGDHG
ncbi:N-acetyltransferase [Acidipropionibacterium jensenii]|uniref:GNAT family N-acetyltransferase n=1 Tax=Acidipropionibacterium jensenii TaxID=1749 RepID=UPI000BC33C26|nr:GNAT family N-acetyltransferase [Acidipropionibacterium jensenii]AZZ42945.1 N-acetyltransferase [Acidipropionibacterium jensenii]